MTWCIKCGKAHFQQVFFLFSFVKKNFSMQDSVLTPQWNEYSQTNKKETLTVGTYLSVFVCLHS
jgi:hypothetical protein